MEIIFQGEISEYIITKSQFCSGAFIIKDKISKRDKSEFITSNVKLLKFSDESLEFKDLTRFSQSQNDENTIVVENYSFQNSQAQLENKQEKIQNTKKPLELETNKVLKNFKNPFSLSYIFDVKLFKNKKQEFLNSEIIEHASENKISIFANLKLDLNPNSFVKIELLNYNDSLDSLSFNLDLFPSGVRYKYGISKNNLHMILLGQMQTQSLLNFLQSFVYKNKNQQKGEKIFQLFFNQTPIYQLKLCLV